MYIYIHIFPINVYTPDTQIPVLHGVNLQRSGIKLVPVYIWKPVQVWTEWEQQKRDTLRRVCPCPAMLECIGSSLDYGNREDILFTICIRNTWIVDAYPSNVSSK